MTHLIAHETGLEVGEFVHTLGDAHLYQNHVEQMQEQLSREVRSFPTLVLNPDKASVFDFDMEDIKVEGYDPHPTIKVIGKEGKLPWHLPNDLKFFKKKTIHNTLVLGRATFEGMGCRPLPNRTTIVLTSNPDYRAEGVLVMHSVEEILAYADNYEGVTVIGGGSVVFKELIPACDVLYRTMIHETFEGDTFFPEIDWSVWEKVATVPGVVDEKNLYAHDYETYHRNDK